MMVIDPCVSVKSVVKIQMNRPTDKTEPFTTDFTDAHGSSHSADRKPCALWIELNHVELQWKRVVR